MRLLKPVALTLALLALTLVARESLAKTETLVDAGVTYVGESQNKDSDVDTKVQRTLVWAKFLYGFPLEQKLRLLLGVDYTGQFVNYKDFTPVTLDGEQIGDSDLPDGLHALDFSATLVWVMSPESSMAFQFKPGIHADTEELYYPTAEDWVYTGSVLYTRHFGANPKNQWGLGVYFGDMLGKGQFLPLVRIRWYPDEKWFVEGTLPSDFDAGYRVNSAWSLGLEASLRGYQYRLSQDDPWDHAVLRYTEGRVGLFADYRFWEQAHVRLSAGAAVAQTFEFRDEDNDDKLVDGDFENAPYGSLNLYYAF